MEPVVEAILLQIPPPVREALWVCVAYHCDRVMYAKHVLLHSLILPLLDLIQSPYHGITVALVIKYLSMCVNRSRMEISLPSSSMRAHLPGYPRRLAKMWGHMPASSYCLRKASTSKHQSLYITSAPGLVDLKIGISNLAGASHFFYLLPLQPLHLHWWPAVSLTVYLSESGAPLFGEEGGKAPLPTVVHWDFGGLLHDRTVPVWVVSLASVTSSTLEALLTCCGALPTSWLEESDPLQLQLEYYGLGSPPDLSAFGGWRQQLIATMPPLEGRG